MSRAPRPSLGSCSAYILIACSACVLASASNVAIDALAEEEGGGFCGLGRLAVNFWWALVVWSDVAFRASMRSRLRRVLFLPGHPPGRLRPVWGTRL